ncbi:hypothetical protein IWX47DRAFT_533631 [Phyllosticta citricarpa]
MHINANHHVQKTNHRNLLNGLSTKRLNGFLISVLVSTAAHSKLMPKVACAVNGCDNRLPQLAVLYTFERKSQANSSSKQAQFQPPSTQFARLTVSNFCNMFLFETFLKVPKICMFAVTRRMYRQTALQIATFDKPQCSSSAGFSSSYRETDDPDERNRNFGNSQTQHVAPPNQPFNDSESSKTSTSDKQVFVDVTVSATPAHLA